jgi:hypothetical protein
MTLRAVLASRYPTRGTFTIGNDINADIARFVGMDEPDRHRIALLMGHMSFGLHEYLAPAARYVTILRDPVARVLSEYRFLKTNTRHPFHARVSSMSVIDYLESGFTGQSSNGQTRLLSGSHEPGRPGIAGREELDMSNVARALDNIDRHFVLAGTQERFEETLLLIAKRLRWRTWPCFIARNVTFEGAADFQFDGSVREAVEAYNALDIALYRAVSERLEARISEAGATFPVALDRFVRVNAIFQRFSAKRIQYANRLRRWLPALKRNGG